MIDNRTVELTHHFCFQRLTKHGYHRLYLIGSRARGDNSLSSDHDFVAIVNDDVPKTLLTGNNPRLIENFFDFTERYGLGKVDLLIATLSRVTMENPHPEDLIPYACQQDGKIMWDLASAPLDSSHLDLDDIAPLF